MTNLHWYTPPIIKWWIKTDLGKKIEDAFGGLFVFAIVVGGGFAWLHNGFSFETREERAARLVCEMAAMKPAYSSDARPLSASDAEVYCAKEKEAEDLWKVQHPNGTN